MIRGMESSRTWYERANALSGSGAGLVVAFAWGVAEALVWPIIPDFIVAILAVANPKRFAKIAIAAVTGSVAGGLIAYLLGGAGIHFPALFTTRKMITNAVALMGARGSAALWSQPFSGIPYKVFAFRASGAHAALPSFLAITLMARGARILAVGAFFAAGAILTRRWTERWYVPFVIAFTIVFAIGLARVRAAWS